MSIADLRCAIEWEAIEDAALAIGAEEVAELSVSGAILGVEKVYAITAERPPPGWTTTRVLPAILWGTPPAVVNEMWNQACWIAPVDIVKERPAEPLECDYGNTNSGPSMTLPQPCWGDPGALWSPVQPDPERPSSSPKWLEGVPQQASGLFYSPTDESSSSSAPTNLSSTASISLSYPQSGSNILTPDAASSSAPSPLYGLDGNVLVSHQQTWSWSMRPTLIIAETWHGISWSTIARGGLSSWGLRPHLSVWPPPTTL